MAAQMHIRNDEAAEVQAAQHSSPRQAARNEGRPRRHMDCHPVLFPVAKEVFDTSLPSVN
jgi:hypothetical protein